MRRRALALLAAAYLFVWTPASFAAELFATLPSLGMRGWPAGLELALHGVVAALAAAAGRMVQSGAPAARPVGSAAVALTAVVNVQSLFWTALPRNIAPGERLPLAGAATIVAAVMLGVVRVVTRDHES